MHVFAGAECNTVGGALVHSGLPMMYRPVRTPDGHERRDGYHRSTSYGSHVNCFQNSLFGTIPTLVVR